MIINPEAKSFDIAGKLNYEERTRAWTLLRLKKEIIHFFPVLKDRHSKIKYKAKVFLSLKAFEDYSNSVLNKESEVPIILYFEREDGKES